MSDRSIGKRAGIVLILPLLAGLWGCHSIGPDSVRRDRFDYSSAMTDSWKTETLLNIIKLRYLDPPIFVDVGQIVSGYSIGYGGSAGYELFPSAHGGNNWNFGVNGSYSDHPTITYTPLTGDNFLQSVVTPLPPESLFFSIQSGWPADVMLKLGVSSLNGVHHESNVGGKRIDNPKFLRVAELLRSLQMAGAVSIRVKKGKTPEDQNAMIMFRASENSPDTAAEVRDLDGLLDLDPTVSDFKLVYGSAASGKNELAVLTKSLMNVMTAMASSAQVPARDVAEGRAMPGAVASGPNDALAGGGPAPTGMFAIHSTALEPSDAFVKVYYRRHWFWIDDRDLVSKRDFAFIMLLSTLSDTTTQQNLPLITIPAQ